MKDHHRDPNLKPLHVLIADDDPGIRTLLEVLCNDLGYASSTVSDGKMAVSAIEAEKPDLVLLDYIMPGMDGFDVIKEIKKNESLVHIPIIMLTGLSSREHRIQGIAAGANDFLTKPIDQEELSLRLKNVFQMKEYQNLLENETKLLDKLVHERTIELQTALDQIKEAHTDAIYRLAILSEYRDSDTGDHIKRIGKFAKLLARLAGYSKEFQEDIYYSAILHDIGKIGIPDSVLLKQGGFEKKEWVVMMSHTRIGADILANSKSPYITMAEKIAHFHHERWDGSGYPQGLTGEDIPMEARITNIVDQYDALRSERPYKKGFTHEKAFEIIYLGDDRTRPEHFDPDLLKCFVTNHLDFRDIFDEMNDEAPLKKKSSS
ncbi:MAG: response regulator [Spirochaetaceae bacterium]|jgi:putative two-component system response regulator|nr:response regulator [Spirochaetaceae bacterium]